MSNTPCAYAVDSVLHRRVEIKAIKRRSRFNESQNLNYISTLSVELILIKNLKGVVINAPLLDIDQIPQ